MRMMWLSGTGVDARARAKNRVKKSQEWLSVPSLGFAHPFGACQLPLLVLQKSLSTHGLFTIHLRVSSRAQKERTCSSPMPNVIPTTGLLKPHSPTEYPT